MGAPVTRNERIMRMWKHDGMSYAEIARELKLSRSTVAGVVWRSGYRLDIVDRLTRQAKGRTAGHKRGDRNG